MEERPDASYTLAPDGVSLAYHVVGNGPLELFWLPGVPMPFDLLWEEPSFAHLVRRLAMFSRTIWFNSRGIGGSGGDLVDNFDEEIRDGDISAVTDDCGCETFVLVGPSMSGPLAIRYAQAHPDRVRSLVLVDSFAHYIREPDYPFGLSESELDGLIASMPQTWGGIQLDMTAPSRAADQGFSARMARAARLGLSPDRAAAISPLVFRIDVRDLLPSLRIPTLILHRQGDLFIQAEAGRYLADHIPGAEYVELPGNDHFFWIGDVDALVDEVEEFLTGARQAPEGEVVTTTILFTDIVASTEQSARLGHRKWGRLIEDHDTAVRSTLQRYRGTEVKTMGDGFLVTFDAASRAVRAATDMVRVASATGLQVRAGVHTGEIEMKSDDVVGLPVSIAKRVCDTARPGQVFVTEVVKLQIEGSGIQIEDRGRHELKGVPGQWPLFAVSG